MKRIRLSLLVLVVLGLAVGIFVLSRRNVREKPARSASSSPAPTPAASVPVQAAPPAANEPRVPAAVAARRFADFGQWLTAYGAAAPADRGARRVEGLRLARERRVAMEQLIESAPRAALRAAISFAEWKSLPPEIRAEVEEPFSALGNYRVLPVCLHGSAEAARFAGTSLPDATRITEVPGREAVISYVFGRRMGLATKENSPVQGIRLGARAALREEVFLALTAAERAAFEDSFPLANPDPARCFATGRLLGDDRVVALSGGKLFRFETPAALAEFENSIASLDTQPGPHSGAAVLFLPQPADGAAGFDLAAAAQASAAQATAWTQTKKRVFMIRVDFSDKPSTSFPVVDAAAYSTVLNTTVADNIRDFSYGVTWIEATVTTDITRLPQTSAYYAQQVTPGNSRNSEILADAKSTYLATHAASSFATYDIVGVWFVSNNMQGSGVGYAGLAGGSDLWIQGDTGAGVLVHEFGHNYGIGHASFWVRSGGSTNPVDPAGANEEYGDPFDAMGNGAIPRGVFHMEAKQRLNWLTANDWTDATAGGSGTYRVFRIDQKNTTGARGLRVTRAANDYYWIGYRRLWENEPLKAGAYVVWQRPGGGRSWLIDTTPNSLAGAADRTDGSVAIGRTYADASANVFVTPLGRGGVTPQEYLDVRVNIGPFPGNQPPTATLSGPTTLAARQTGFFTVQASDPNGDPLAYAWDFGGGFTFDNNASAPFVWNVGGSYTVKVTVSDMKGQATTATLAVTVSDPLTTWTPRSNPATAGMFTALAANSNQVLVVGEDYSSFSGHSYISSDGVTWSSNTLGSPRVGYGAAWDGSQWIVAGMEFDFGISAWKGAIFTSTNATSWTRRYWAGQTLRTAAVSGAVRVVTGDGGAILRSLDGVTWVAQTSGTTNHLEGLASGGGKFLATGYAGGNGGCVVLHSADGQSWINMGPVAGLDSWQDFRRIAYGGGAFLAVGWYSKLRTSLDAGLGFSTSRQRTEDTPAMAYGNGVWLAAGVDRDAGNADIDLVSLNAVTWSQLPAAALADRRAAIFFKNTFITVGDDHTIRQSGAFQPASPGFTAWRDAYFPNRDVTSTFGADADLDGLATLLEYSLGRSPLSSAGSDGASAAPRLVVSGNPLLSDRMALECNLPEPSPADLVWNVEGAGAVAGPWSAIASKTGTAAWTWLAGGTSRIVAGTPAGGRVLVTVGDSQSASSAPTRFLRLRARINQ